MKLFAVFFISFCLFLIVLTAMKVEASSSSSSERPRVTVELPLGKLEGEERKSLSGKKFYAFEGVPYAAPPTGKNRFREPQEVQKWTSTKVVNKNSIECTQYIELSSPTPPYDVQGVEDCLILNIYTTSLNQKANLDVAVFIHPGGFMYFSGYLSGPNYLLDNDIVYINLNHRVGPLGFLSTEDEVISGNMGMLDQTMALKFIQIYVEYFGGNNQSVTLTGDSAGGAPVHFHMLSPRSKGLFQKAASFSGTMFNAYALVENAREKTEKVAALVNCSRSSMQEAVDCMRTKSATDIVATVQKFLPWMYLPSTPFGIVIDSWAKNPSLPEHPLKLIKQGKVQNVPWIVSHTNSEGLLPGCGLYYDKLLGQIDTQWNEILPHLLEYNYTVEPSLRDKVSQQIREYYMGNKTVNKQTFLDFVQLITDRTYLSGITKAVKLYLQYVENASVQLYFFTYRGTDSLCNKKTDTHEDFGATHLEDITYIFDTSFADTSKEKRDAEMVKVMVKIYVSFARTGTADCGIHWPKATKDKLNRLHIAGPQNLKIDTEVFTNDSFWDSLPIMENEKLFQSDD